MPIELERILDLFFRTHKPSNISVLLPIWFLAIVDVHIRLIIHMQNDLFVIDMPEFFLRLLASIFLTLPVITGVGYFRGNRTLFRWLGLLFSLFLWPYGLTLLNSSEVVDLERFFSGQTWVCWILGMGLSLYAIKSNQPKADVGDKVGFWGKWLSLNNIVFLLAVLWALGFALVLSSIDDAMLNQPFPFYVSLSKIAGDFLGFLNYFIQLLVLASLVASIFFINRYVLIQRVLSSYGFTYFILSAFVFIIVFTPILASIAVSLPINDLPAHVQNISPGGGQNVFDLDNYQFAFIILLLTTPIILAFERQEQHSRLNEIKARQVQTELAFLQQQVNPHFLFNTLNNLYALSLENSPQAPNLIMQLSDLLRYCVYEGQKNWVPVQKELDYVKNYLDLQALRLGEENRISLSLPKDDVDGFIPPLLIINILENAFKHGVEPNRTNSKLNCAVQVANNHVIFNCENTYDDTGSEGNGVGLSNLRRRLKLIYGVDHCLQIQKGNGMWKVTLTMEMRADESDDR